MKKKTHNTPVYLGLSILEISKIGMYEFGMTEQNQNKTKKENYVIQIQIVSLSIEKTENTYEGITKNVVNKFDMSNYELERLQVKRKKQKKSSL